MWERAERGQRPESFAVEQLSDIAGQADADRRPNPEGIHT
jgi:hypothetical protein